MDGYGYGWLGKGNHAKEPNQTAFAENWSLFFGSFLPQILLYDLHAIIRSICGGAFIRTWTERS
jgi:hypothetical protein